MHFTISLVRMDGYGYTEILRDPQCELTHARISPDQQWVLATRFTQIGPTGVALESQGYARTEIVSCRLDGSGLMTLIPARDSTVAANASWTPDGRGFVYVGCAPGGVPEIRHFAFAGSDTRLPTPQGIVAVDPHWSGDWIVFAGPTAIHRMHPDGTDLHAVTASAGPYPIDRDPRLSPNGEHVAMMRQVSPNGWRTVVYSPARNGYEQDLSPAIEEGKGDCTPDWDASSEMLVYMHVEPDPWWCGLYTMTRNGDRKAKVFLPPRPYTHPSFVPGDAYGADARIIFGASVLD